MELILLAMIVLFNIVEQYINKNIKILLSNKKINNINKLININCILFSHNSAYSTLIFSK